MHVFSVARGLRSIAHTKKRLQCNHTSRVRWHESGTLRKSSKRVPTRHIRLYCELKMFGAAYRQGYFVWFKFGVNPKGLNQDVDKTWTIAAQLSIIEIVVQGGLP
eukprot:160138-Amphidinium_carterae.1